jgi:hypothetical protein
MKWVCYLSLLFIVYGKIYITLQILSVSLSVWK